MRRSGALIGEAWATDGVEDKRVLIFINRDLVLQVVVDKLGDRIKRTSVKVVLITSRAGQVGRTHDLRGAD
jgi:hypothetical protein